ncbi:hypothetical protein PAMP_012809 [Pampus punctatissimus]
MEVGGGIGEDMSVQVCCLSFCQPYAGLVLDGVKMVESRWRPLLVPLENQTLAVHIAQRDWEGEEWWKDWWMYAGPDFAPPPHRRRSYSSFRFCLQEKYLSHLSNPRWLKQPLSARGGRDLWTV